MSNRRWLITLGLICFATPVFASDAVKLRGGATIRGLILDHRSNDDAIRLRTEHGELPILGTAIEQIERDPDPDTRYWLAREYFDETAVGYYELALWCDANGLEDARDEHLNDVLQLDADHAAARRLLGFVRRGREWVAAQPATDSSEPDPAIATAVGGSVSRRSERMDMLRARQESLRKQREIDQAVVRIAARLESINALQVKQARSDLAEIRDPLAIGPLIKAMPKASVGNRVRLLQAIGEIPAPESSYALAIAAVADLAPEVRETAIDQMRARPQDRERFVPVLEQALRSEKAGLVYNGADALEALGQRESVPRLIDALTTPTRTIKSSDSAANEPQSNWVRGLKLTDVWAGSSQVPIRAPS